MYTALTIPELTYSIASCLSSQADISSFNQCNRRLHGITIPLLYHDIKISTFEVGFLARSLEENATLSKLVQKLSITLNFTSSKCYHQADEELQKRLLCDLKLVINQCSSHGSLRHFCWDFHPIKYPPRCEWLMSALQTFNLLSFPAPTFQSLQSIIVRDRRHLLCSIHNLDTELLSQCSFRNVSRLEIDFKIADCEFQGSRRLLSAFPNVKVLVLTARNKVDFIRIPDSDGMTTLLPDIKYKQLVSLTFSTGPFAASVYPVSFVDEQSSLTELHMNVRPMRHSLGTSSVVKGLSLGSNCFSDSPPPGHFFGSLSILRLRVTKGKVSNAWKTLFDDIQHLKCIEIVQPFGNYLARIEHIIWSLKQTDLIEIGIISDEPIPVINTRTFYSLFTLSLDSLLASCCMMKSVRAFRLACTIADYVEEKREHPHLPDEHTLESSKIPIGLEYVLLEDPWEKKLYKVERRSNDTTKMVYTGLERLPGRCYNPYLTWSNDSILDHMHNAE